MLLIDREIQQAMEQAEAAFPHFTDWQYNNETNGEYFGFSIWGEFVLNPEDPMARRFFITLDTYQESWRGHLTIGQHFYLWSSADVGDAHLLGTGPCQTSEDAIAALKGEVGSLCKAFSAV